MVALREDFKYQTEDDMRKIEKLTGKKYELINGQLIAMAGAEGDHGILIHSFTKLLDRELEKRNCKAIPDTLEVLVEKENNIDIFKPDITVVCSPFEISTSKTDSPTMVVEILSKSSVITDLNEKKDSYLKIPDLKAYIVVNKWEKEIVVFQLLNNSAVSQVYKENDIIEIKDWLKISVNEVYNDLEKTKNFLSKY